MNITAQTHLLNRNGSFYFRVKIPADLQQEFGKKEEKFSLRTKNYTEAKRLAHQASARFDEKCQKLRKRTFSQNADQETFILDSAVEQEICEIWKFHTLDGDEWARQQGLFSDEFEEQSQARLETHDFLRELLIHEDSEKILPALGQFLDLLGVNLSGDAESWQRLRYQFYISRFR